MTQGLNVVNPGISEGVNVKMYPNMQADQMVESGKQMVSAGANLKIMSDQIMLNQAETSAKDYDNQIADNIRTKMSNPDTGFLSTAGKNSVDQRESFVKDLNKSTKDFISNNIKDPLVAGIVSRSANARLQNAMQTADSHTLTQGRVYKESVFVASMNTSVNDIAAALVANENNPATRGKLSPQVAAYTAARDAEFKQHFADLGIDEKNPIYKDALMKMNTKQAQDVTNNWVNQGKTTMAKAYLDANKDKIDQTSLIQLERLVNIASISKESLVLANTLPGNFEQKQAELDKRLKNETIPDELYRATSQQINKLESEYKQKVSDTNARIESSAYEILNNNPDMKITDLPAQLQQQIQSVPKLYDKVQKYVRDGNQFKTDADTYNTLSTTDPQTLAKISDSEFYNSFRFKLNNDDYKSMLERRSLGLGGEEKGALNIVSTQDQINNALKNAGIMPKKGSGNLDEQQYVYNVSLEIQKRITAEQARIGSKDGLGTDATDKIIDSVLMERIKTPGALWNILGNKEVSPYETFSGRENAIKLLRSRGIPETAKNIEAAMQSGAK